MAWDGWPLPMHQYISYQVDSIISHMMFQWYSYDGEIPWRCHEKSHYLRYVRCGKPMVFEGESSTNGCNHIQPAWFSTSMGQFPPPAIHVNPMVTRPWSPLRGALRQVRSPVSPASPVSPWPCGSTVAAAMRCYGGISAGRRHWSTGRLGLDGTG